MSTSQTVTATATLEVGTTFTDTSQFAPAVAVKSAFLVTNTNASGTGSLEQAILNVNSDTADTSTNPDTITFAIPTSTTPYTIDPPTTGFSFITRPVVLDGTSQAGYAGTPVIEIDGSGLSSAAGLTLATNASTAHNLVGQHDLGLEIVDFAYAGIDIDGTDNNLIQSNIIGASGMPNGEGVLVNGSNNLIGGTAAGAANVIAFNTGDGVDVQSGSGDAILENSIFANGGLGIKLASGANDGQSPPALDGATLTQSFTLVQGQLADLTSTSGITLEFFASASH